MLMGVYGRNVGNQAPAAVWRVRRDAMPCQSQSLRLHLTLSRSDDLHTGVNPLVASSPGNLNFSSFVSWLTIRASSRVKLTKPIAGNTGFCPRLFCGCAGPEDDFDILNATRPAPAAVASPRVAGETEARSLRGVAIVYRNKYGMNDRVTVNR